MTDKAMENQIETRRRKTLGNETWEARYLGLMWATKWMPGRSEREAKERALAAWSLPSPSSEAPSSHDG